MQDFIRLQAEYGNTIFIATSVYTTYDDSLFVNAEENRDIVKNNNKLLDSILEYGMRMEMPIVVVEKMFDDGVKRFVIIDGGQRFAARQRVLEHLRKTDEKAELPIYFMISNDENYCRTLALFNNTQTKWNTADYVKFWVKVRGDRSLESAPFRLVKRLVDEFAKDSERKPYDTFLNILTHNNYKKKKMMEGFLPELDEQFFREVMELFIKAKKNNKHFPIGKSEFIKAFVNFYTHEFPKLEPNQQKHFINKLMRCDGEKNGSENQYAEFFTWAKVATSKNKALIKGMQFKEDCRKKNK